MHALNSCEFRKTAKPVYAKKNQFRVMMRTNAAKIRLPVMTRTSG